MQAGLLLVAGLASGCYDGHALVEHARSVALNTRLAEVDLGIYHTTLPRDSRTGLYTETEVHLFGTVPRYRVPAIEQQLKTEEYLVRHKVLAALRSCSREELAEPSLRKLRSRVEKVMNGVLDDAPVRAIGVSNFRLREM